LLQPIGITPDCRLVFGQRRLLVYQDILGQESIPARIVPVESMRSGEIAENTMRKDYTAGTAAPIRLAVAMLKA
jgi:ParB family chromosome partitioning protein